jgi:hypothetical protein
MKTKLKLIAICHLLAAICLSAFAQGTAFTYQGQLQNNGSPASGTYNLTFTLFATNTTGVAIAGPVTNSAVAVTNGLFTVTIDFGSGVFTGATDWLQIGVETNGASSFTALTPRQELTPTPYAIYAEGANAAGLSGTIPAANFSGTYGSPVAFNNGANSFDGSFYGAFYGSSFIGGDFVGNFIGNGSGLTDVWQTGGNSGTTAGVNFVGTTDNQPLELHVNGQRALRLTPDNSTNNSPDIIGGSPVNTLAPGLVGVTISGGGAPIYNGRPVPNQALGDFNTIGGGYGNTTGSTNFDVTEATVAGGALNSASGITSAIGGGANNVADGNNATVAGGLQNRANFHSFVGSGYGNTADGVEAAIGGGHLNNIQTNTVLSTIGGGWGNTIQGNNYEAGATIGGGTINTIQASSVLDGNNPYGYPSSYSTIGGGYLNLILTNSPYSTIAGGWRNTVQPNDPYATIGGGYFNTNGGFASVIGGGEQNNTSGGDGAVIGGGYLNTNESSAATIGGGQYNFIGFGADHATIAGGGGNSIFGSATLPVYCTIGGGNGNVIQTNVSFSTIGGGVGNVIQTLAHNAVIGGGANNTNFAPYATIPGGLGNAAGANAFAAGTGAQALNQGSFVWADTSSPNAFSSTNNNSFNIRAAGGVRIATTSSGTIGALLAAGSTSWTTLSDRNAKKNIMPVDCLAVLDKLAHVPVEQWNYKWEKDSDTPNFGPMAQDFKHAFYPGRDDKGISTLEFDGVELAAIQGLNQKLNAKDVEIQELKQQNETLEKRLDNLAQMVKSLSDKN